MKKIVFYGAALVLALTACKDEPSKTGQLAPQPRKAIIGMEGQTPEGISSLAEYDIAGQGFNNSVYRKANQSTLGTGLTDLYADDDEGLLFAILPNSSRIKVIDLQNFELLRNLGPAEAEGFRSMMKVGPQKYYVSSWDDEGVVIMRGQRFNFGQVIPTGLGPSAMTQFKDLAFIANAGGNFLNDSTVTIIRSTADTLVDSLYVGVKPNSMAIDGRNNLWVLCSGKFNSNFPTQSGVGSLWRYNLDTMYTAIDSGFAITPDTVYYFTDNQLRPRHLVVNQAGEQLFYLSDRPGDVMTMSTVSGGVSNFPAVTGEFYSLVFDEMGIDLYALEAAGADSDQDGFVKIFSPDLSIKNSFKIGVRPTDVVFK